MQLVQLEASDAPVDPKKVPARQLVHEDAPVDAAYVPIEQLRQDEAPSASAKVPNAQLVHTLAPAPEYAPARQTTHVDDKAAPVELDAVPARQLTQPVDP